MSATRYFYDCFENLLSAEGHYAKSESYYYHENDYLAACRDAVAMALTAQRYIVKLIVQSHPGITLGALEEKLKHNSEYQAAQRVIEAWGKEK